MSVTDGTPVRKILVTTSWDDGHPADLKLAELLAKYGVAATFYVPTSNSEGRPVMKAPDVLKLSSKFEIGGHGSEHRVLTKLSIAEVRSQIADNKVWLENVMGRRVEGFCYVRGQHNAAVSAVVRELGFSYARVASSFHTHPGTNPYVIPTSVQFFEHDRGSILRHLVKGGLKPKRLRLALRLLLQLGVGERIDSVLDACRREGGLFHLWGHSWELEDFQLWGKLEDFLQRLSDQRAEFEMLDNYHAFQRAGLIAAA